MKRTRNRICERITVVVFDPEHLIPIASYVVGASTVWTKLNGEQQVNNSHRTKSRGLRKTLLSNQEPQNFGKSTTNVIDDNDIPELDVNLWETSPGSPSADSEF
jgi:ABC-type iron transport system FetAB permease component